MEMMVEIDAPQLLPQLLIRLRAAGLSVLPLSPCVGRVVDGAAPDAEEALCELRFFVRAWARAHGDVAAWVWPA